MKRTADVNSSFICFASAEKRYHKVVGFSDLKGPLEPDLFWFFSPLINDKGGSCKGTQNIK